MRLKKLIMQAFGPFKDKVVIDFEKDKIDKGLLLITGDTGAGKTTIFDMHYMEIHQVIQERLILLEVIGHLMIWILMWI